MIKKTITYTDYNGVSRTEDFYFNLSKAEILELEQTTPGGITAQLQALIDAQDVPQITKVFKELILKAYGIKSVDGRRFMKSPEILQEFVETEAYSELYTMLSTDVDFASEFVKGIFPSDVAAQAAATPVNAQPINPAIAAAIPGRAAANLGTGQIFNMA